MFDRGALRLFAGLLVVVTLLGYLPRDTRAAPESKGEITNFPVPLRAGPPLNITIGPDGNLWFTETYGVIGRITPVGGLTEFEMPRASGAISASVALNDITAGPDGNLWFTIYGNNEIGRITPAGVITEFPMSTQVPPPDNSYPFAIAAGPDGNIWFTEYLGNKIGRLTTPASGATTATIVEFAVPTLNSVPYDITAGLDGNLWFTEKNTNKIGRITPAGVISEFQVPASSTDLRDIVAGPDGNLWMTDAASNRIWRSTPAGAFTKFDVPTSGGFPKGIAVGPDGNIWFTEVDGNKLGRVTPAGTIDEFSIFPDNIQPQGITTGPDGRLWYANYASGFRPVSWTSFYISRFAPSSLIKECSLPPAVAGARQLAAGADGVLWFAAYPDGIVRVTPTCEVTLVAGTKVGGEPTSMTVGPEGYLWYTLQDQNEVGMIAPDGAVTRFPVSGPGLHPREIIVGPDNSLWFTMRTDHVGCIIPNMGQMMQYPLTVTNKDNDGNAITVGPSDKSGQKKKSIWLTQPAASQIWRIDTDCGSSNPHLTPFPPTLQPRNPYPSKIVAGPDDNIWFTLYDSKTIRRIQGDGTFLDPYNLPDTLDVTDRLIAGPDGNIWFRSTSNKAIVRMTIHGDVTTYEVPYVDNLLAGADGNLWFIDTYNIQVGRITPSGSVTTFGLPALEWFPAFTVDPHGAIWITYSNKAGRLLPPRTIFLPLAARTR